MASAHAQSLTRRRSGFTVTELLVVISIIALVIGIVMVVFPKVTAGARSSVCLNNQRGIAVAATAYAASNKGRLPSPRTEAPPDWPTDKDTPPYKHYWVAAFSHFLSVHPTRELPAALENGSLWPYMGDRAKYHSPQDPTDRLRSYSLNGFVGVTKPDDTATGQAAGIDSHYRFNTTSLSALPEPSKTLYSLPEWDRSDLTIHRDYNYNSFIIDPDWHKHFWFDSPAMWNGNDINISYADASTGQIPIFDKKLVGTDSDGHDFQDRPPSKDYFQMRGLLLPGLIRNP